MPAAPPSPTLQSRLQALFEAQAEAALRLRGSSAAERIARIRALRDAVLAHAQDWYRAAHADFHKPAAEVDLAEILPVCVEANTAIRHLHRWMRPRRVWPTLLTLGTRSQVQAVPRGRCLIIGPFNYPVNLTLGPLVSAVAAGNTVILKPSELTPHLSALVATVVREVFPENEVAVVEGDATLAQALLELPFDHIFFTGSPAVGRLVMGAAARHLASVTLELGGKSPAIVDETADLPLAARNLMWAKCANAGQTCIAPDHVYVHESVREAWVAACRAELESAFGSTLEAQRNSPHLAHMVNPRHGGRVRALLDDARALGAHTLAGGTSDGAFVQPTLLDQLPAQARVMQEEIFGPLLPVIGYRDLGDVIRQVNAADRPLALYIYSRNQAHIDGVLGETLSGSVCVNHSMLQFLHARLPFGGVRQSGLGSAHGYHGFRAFSHERSVVRAQFTLVARLLRAGAMPAWLRRLLQAGFRIF